MPKLIAPACSGNANTAATAAVRAASANPGQRSRSTLRSGTSTGPPRVNASTQALRPRCTAVPPRRRPVVTGSEHLLSACGAPQRQDRRVHPWQHVRRPDADRLSPPVAAGHPVRPAITRQSRSRRLPVQRPISFSHRDALGVPVDQVDVRIGDTDYPIASVAGGSSGTSTWGSAIVEAARAFRDKYGPDPSDGDEAQGHVPENQGNKHYAMYASGAQFAEVRVHADTGEIRVPRLLGVFAAGRIINPRTARSQFIGGMTMGLSMALHETSVLDPRTGHVVNHDFAEYHIATCADAANVRAYWVDEHDPHVNPMGAKGIGEIGIVGTAAAIANAAHHATGCVSGISQ